MLQRLGFTVGERPLKMGGEEFLRFWIAREAIQESAAAA
jgi:hypothetical protein